MILTRPTAMPHTLALADRAMYALGHFGFAAAETMRIHIVLHSFVQGVAVNLETEAEALGESGTTSEEWIGSQTAGFARLGAELPHFMKILTELDGGFELDLDAIFELGLRTLLDGLAARR